MLRSFEQPCHVRRLRRRLPQLKLLDRHRHQYPCPCRRQYRYRCRSQNPCHSPYRCRYRSQYLCRSQYLHPHQHPHRHPHPRPRPRPRRHRQRRKRFLPRLRPPPRIQDLRLSHDQNDFGLLMFASLFGLAAAVNIQRSAHRDCSTSGGSANAGLKKCSSTFDSRLAVYVCHRLATTTAQNLPPLQSDVKYFLPDYSCRVRGARPNPLWCVPQAKFMDNKVSRSGEGGSCATHHYAKACSTHPTY